MRKSPDAMQARVRRTVADSRAIAAGLSSGAIPSRNGRDPGLQ